MLKNHIEFTLESGISWTVIQEDDDYGLTIFVNILYVPSTGDNINSNIVIDIDFFKSNGTMIETKDFKLNPFVDSDSQKVLSEAINYIEKLGNLIEERLANDYLKR